MTQFDSPASLPPAVKWGGYVYVVSFSNGTVKPGSSKEPARRIAGHQSAAAAFNIEIRNCWVSPWHDNYLANEQRLIETAIELGGHRTRREYFTDITAENLVRFAQQLTFSPVDVATHENAAKERAAQQKELTRQALSASYDDHIRKLVDQAPPLSESTRAALSTLLRPATRGISSRNAL